MFCSMLFDLSSCVATVAMIDAAEAAPHSSRHDGDVRPIAIVSQAVNDWPPTAGPAVSAATRLPPTMVVLSSRRLRGTAAAKKRSTSARLARMRPRMSSLDTAFISGSCLRCQLSGGELDDERCGLSEVAVSDPLRPHAEVRQPGPGQTI